MSKIAVLSFWDPDLGETYDLKITWDKGYDQDAKFRIPKRYKRIWDTGFRLVHWDHKINDEPVSPYGSIPYSVELKNLKRSATGAFAIFDRILDKVGWRVPPPYPKLPPEPQFAEGIGNRKVVQ